MDLYICGFIDIFLVACFLAFVIIGYKEGLLTRVINLAKGLGGLLVSIFLVKPVGNWFNKISFIHDPIYNKIDSNIATKINHDAATMSTDEILDQIGIPKFLQSILIDKLDLSLDMSSIINDISNIITKFIIFVGTFVFLLLFMTVGLTILKFIVKTLRESSKIIKFVDGFLGMVFGVCVFLFATYAALLIISVVVQVSGPTSDFTKFIITDMQLETEKFRLSKYLYENNILGNIFRLLFG